MELSASIHCRLQYNQSIQVCVGQSQLLTIDVFMGAESLETFWFVVFELVFLRILISIKSSVITCLSSSTSFELVYRLLLSLLLKKGLLGSEKVANALKKKCFQEFVINMFTC
jgi:hypothetical protein